MNEVDFVALARSCRLGDLILFSISPIDNPGYEQSRGFADESIVGAGFVLPFVDPAKPLIIYRGAVSDRPSLGVDFFQDLLYAATPRIKTRYFTILRGETGPETAERWLLYLEDIVGHKLRGDTPLFDAYQSGALGATYAETDEGLSHGVGDLSSWVLSHLDLLGLAPDTLRATGGGYDVWKDHDVYSFR